MIPPPGHWHSLDENPPIYYASAFRRLLEWIWHLRIRHPDEDIRLIADDISAAFRWVLYHPSVAVAFATVFKQWLIIPVGLIFGARNSPSFYMLPGELRAWLASVGQFASATADLMARVHIPPTPPTVELAQATADDRQDGSMLDEVPEGRFHAAYVDDQGTAHTSGRIWDSVNNSVLAAYIIFSFPGEDRRPPCINPKKWSVTMAAIMLFLGFEIDTRRMIVRWPREKRMMFRKLLRTTVLRARPDTTHAVKITPQTSSRILGTVRNAAAITPVGNLLSLNLQRSLNAAYARQFQQDPRQIHKRQFWQRTWFRTPNRDIQDLRLLDDTLDDDKVWERSIGLLIPRTPYSKPTGDASYAGLGGYCIVDKFMWRLSADDLRAYGIHVPTEEELAADRNAFKNDADLAHINVLEFVTIIINLWFSFAFQRRHPDRREFVYEAVADNTSALSWIEYSGRRARHAVANLARFLTRMALCHPQTRIQGQHLAGILNGPADALSRPDEHPTWACVIEQHSETLADCQAYQVPRELLSVIASLLSNKPIEAPTDDEMTALLMLEPVILPPGWRTSGSFVTSAERP